jgi:hypothetical protein
MKLLCPKCGIENDQDLNAAGMMQCSACGEWFKGVMPAPGPRPNSPAGFQKKISKLGGDADPKAGSIMDDRGGHCGNSWYPGFLFLLLAGDASAAVVIGGGCLSSAVVFYLIAQVIHIRANSEK